MALFHYQHLLELVMIVTKYVCYFMNEISQVPTHAHFYSPSRGPTGLFFLFIILVLPIVQVFGVLEVQDLLLLHLFEVFLATHLLCHEFVDLLSQA